MPQGVTVDRSEESTYELPAPEGPTARAGFACWGQAAVGDVVSSRYSTVLTLSTVGDGTGPLPGRGRKVFTVSLILFGVVALFTAIGAGTEVVASGELGKWLRMNQVTRSIGHLSVHYVICAYRRVGRAVTGELQRRSYTTVVIESKPELQPLPAEHAVRHISVILARLPVRPRCRTGVAGWPSGWVPGSACEAGDSVSRWCGCGDSGTDRVVRGCARLAVLAGAGVPGADELRAPRPPAGTSGPWSSGWPARTPAGATAESTASWPAWERR
jgi:hypothetical protein